MLVEEMFIFDIGKASFQCQKSQKDSFVLSVTDDRIVDHQLTEEDIILCDQADKLLYTAMKQLMPTPDGGKEEHSYLVYPRKKLFLQKHITSPINATRYATTYMDHVLGVHIDSQNPSNNHSLSDSFMNQLVGSFAKKRGPIRVLLIGFGREYIVNTAISYSKFGPCLEIINMFYNKIPDD